MDNTVFRTKVEPVETVEVKSEHSDTPTISVHEHTEKPLELDTYIQDLWNLGEAKDHFEMPSLIKEINDFVLSEIDRNKMDRSRDSYKEIVESYEKRLKLPEGIDVYTKTEKIASLMRIDMKLLGLAKEKEELLSKDITELTSKQLAERIKNGRGY